jgi:hypothetical protein
MVQFEQAFLAGSMFGREGQKETSVEMTDTVVLDRLAAGSSPPEKIECVIPYTIAADERGVRLAVQSVIRDARGNECGSGTMRPAEGERGEDGPARFGLRAWAWLTVRDPGPYTFHGTIFDLSVPDGGVLKTFAVSFTVEIAPDLGPPWLRP